MDIVAKYRHKPDDIKSLEIKVSEQFRNISFEVRTIVKIRATGNKRTVKVAQYFPNMIKFRVGEFKNSLT